MGALIEDASYEGREHLKTALINEIELDKIEFNPFQPRKEFNEEAIDELSVSIKQLGVIQPITIRKVVEGDNEKFQLISGERRLRAARKAGITRIPAFIRETDDQGMLELALVENIQREDLNPIEIAICYQRLIDECTLTHEDLSGRVGKKRQTIGNYLRLLKLPADIQIGLRDNRISMGHARALVSIESPNKQQKIFQKIIKEGLSVRKVEELAKQINEPPKKEKSKDEPKTEAEYKQLQEHLSKCFEAKIDFKRNKKGNGKIVIPFKSDEDLERIIALIDKMK